MRRSFEGTVLKVQAEKLLDLLRKLQRICQDYIVYFLNRATEAVQNEDDFAKCVGLCDRWQAEHELGVCFVA